MTYGSLQSSVKIQHSALDRVKNYWAEGQTNCEVICTFPEDAEEMQVVRVNGKGFKGTGDVCLGQQGSLACKADKGDGMIECSVLHEEVRAGSQTIDAWDSGAVGG